jgi:OTT_1508-like deaminase
VQPPEAIPIEVLSGSLEVLNLRIGQMVSEITPIGNWKLVTDTYQKAQPGQPIVGKKTVNFTQHCELTLALEMLKRYNQRKITKRRIEIGVSKACCDWCCQYLKLLSSAYPNHPILVRASHGKQPDGWMIPPDSSKSIAEEMAKSIVDKLDDVIWEIQSGRRSDSNELADIMELDTDLGAEDLEEVDDIDFTKDPS